MIPSTNGFQLVTRVALVTAFLLAFAWGNLHAQTTDGAPPTVITLGDSITKGVRLGVSESHTFASILGKENGQRVVNVGIGGERTDQALKRLDEQVIALRPRFVLLMYGTNDSYIDQGKTASRISVAAGICRCMSPSCPPE